MAERSESPMELLSPFCGHDDAMRRSMLGIHTLQSIAVEDGDIDTVNSIYGQIAHAGSTYKIADENIEILERYELFNHKFVLFKRLDNNALDIVFVDINKNEFMRPSKVSSKKILKKGEILVEHESSNKFLNLGMRAKTGVILDKGTFEDAIMVSESFANRIKFYGEKNYLITIDEDQEMVNLNEDKSVFKPIPDKTDDLLLVLRKRSSLNFLSFKKENLDHPDFLRDYKTFKAEGDVEFFVYISEDTKQVDTRTWRWLRNEFERTLAVHKIFINDINKLIDENKELKMSSALANLYNYYLAFVNCKLNKYNKKPLTGALLNISVRKRYNISEGSKLSNKHGLKGLIKIYKDEEMFKLNGQPLDIVFGAETVQGRMNMGAIREMQMNRIIEIVEKNIKKFAKNKDTHDLAISGFEEFLNICNLNIEIDKEELITMFNDPEFELIALIDKPNIKAINEFKPKLKREISRDEQTFKATVGTMYFHVLKHEPIKKSSAVALPAENEKGMPIRSNKKEYLKLNDSASKWGTMELDHLFSAAPAIAEEFVRFRSQNRGNREELARQLMMNPIDEVNINAKVEENVSTSFFKEMLISLGIKL